MNRKTILASATVAMLAATGCSTVTSAVTGVCTDIANLPPTAVSVLQGQPASSALGVLWADAKSGCANGVAVAGVDTSWTGQVWGMLKAIAPTVIPMLLGLV